MELSYSESKRSTANKSINLNRRTIMKKVIEGTIAGLVWNNPSKEDDCKITNLIPNWEKVLSNYMSSCYIKCNTFEVHNMYFIAIEDVDEDTIETLNRCNITIYSIDYIVDTIMICFKDEASRDMVFNVIKKEVA